MTVRLFEAPNEFEPPNEKALLAFLSSNE